MGRRWPTAGRQRRRQRVWMAGAGRRRGCAAGWPGDRSIRKLCGTAGDGLDSVRGDRAVVARHRRDHDPRREVNACEAGIERRLCDASDGVRASPRMGGWGEHDVGDAKPADDLLDGRCAYTTTVATSGRAGACVTRPSCARRGRRRPTPAESPRAQHAQLLVNPRGASCRYSGDGPRPSDDDAPVLQLAQLQGGSMNRTAGRGSREHP